MLIIYVPIVCFIELNDILGFGNGSLWLDDLDNIILFHSTIERIDICEVSCRQTSLLWRISSICQLLKQCNHLTEANKGGKL